MKSQSATKTRLYRENPHCFWCGVRTRLIEQKDGVQMPDEAATVDRVRSRFTPTKIVDCTRWPQDIKVLCCFRCNRERDKGYVAKAKAPPRPLSDRVRIAQTDVCCAAVRFVRDGGTFAGAESARLSECVGIVQTVWAEWLSEKDYEELAF